VSPAKVEVCAYVKIYSYLSFRSIEEVLDVWQRPGNSGGYTLEDKKEFCNTNLPATAITINASGVVTVSSSTSVGGEFSYSALDSFGFSMSGSSTSSWYARKGYNKYIGFDLY